MVSSLISITHPQPIGSTTPAASSRWADHAYTIPNMQVIMGSLARDAELPQYRAFFAWLVQATQNESRTDARNQAMFTYVFHNPHDILRTSPFPVPPKMEEFYAFLYDVDRQMAENDEKERLEKL